MKQVSADEINTAELGILLWLLRGVEGLNVDVPEFTEQQAGALKEAKKRIRAKLNDQIKFKQGQINKKGRS